MNDRHVGAEPLHNLHDVRGQEHGGSARHALLQEIPEQTGPDRIHPFERLVQEEQVGSGQQGRGQGELLFHSVGEVQGRLGVFAGQSHERQELFGALGHHGQGQIVHPADEQEIFPGREVIEQRRVFGNHADAATQWIRAFRVVHVHAEQPDAPAAGGQHGRKHVERGGLAGAIRAR